MQFRAARCGHPSLRGTRSTVGRDDVGIVPYERWQEMLRITRQTQSVSLLRQGSAGPRERPADATAETMRRQGANFAHPGPRGKRRPTWTTPQPRKGFQNLGFGGVLSSLSFAAERKGAVGDIKTAAPGERIAAAAERPRNDRVFHELRCNSGRRGVVTPPYGGQGVR